jgi:hypothetical protein
MKPQWDAQVHDHRFPTLDSDPGSVERAHAVHSKATGRNQSDVAENSVTDSILESARRGVAAGETLAAGKVPGANDATLSWGRAGAVEATVGRNDTPVIPKGSGMEATVSSSTTSTEPSRLGTRIEPVRSGGASGNQNMEAISRYPYGGSR